jgi:hypothetical protein
MANGATLWLGRVLTALFTLFMLGGSVAPKLAGAKVARDAMLQLGWDPRYITMIGAMELTFVLIHLHPRTSILGAVLMTALLGGGIAAQLRAEQPLFTHVLFGVYLGIVMWGGLWLRDPTLRTFVPIRVG